MSKKSFLLVLSVAFNIYSLIILYSKKPELKIDVRNDYIVDMVIEPVDEMEIATDQYLWYTFKNGLNVKIYYHADTGKVEEITRYNEFD